MASQVSVLRIQQELKGLAEVTDRCPTPQRPSLGCLRYRAAIGKPRSRRTRQKLKVEIAKPGIQPQSIPITFLPKPLPGTPLPPGPESPEVVVRILAIPPL